MATMRSFGALPFLILLMPSPLPSLVVAVAGGSAPCRCKDSQSSRVKMSFVTAAREYLSQRARQRASINAILPEPTGLYCLEA